MRGSILAICALLALSACGSEPDGALVEVHAALDASVDSDLLTYRVYRVNIQGGADSAIREVERRGEPPDVFVVRSPITVPDEGDAYSIYVRVQALLFTMAGDEVIAACAEQGDVAIIEGAVNILDLTLMPGDCL